jgi:hypothetical protein
MTTLGFKRLTLDNWLQPDGASTAFGSISPIDGKPRSTTANERLGYILRPQLTEKVPIEVSALFEVARGAMVYGYFFYPLYALGCEQLFRVVETAVNLKCKAMGVPSKVQKFYEKLEWLVLMKVISEEEKNIWHALRELRNLASHPQNQTILPPGMVIGIVERIADKINFLFESTSE